MRNPLNILDSLLNNSRFTFHASRLTPHVSFILIAATLILTGCVSLQDPEASQEYRSETVATLTDGQVFGQSFISRRPGLNGIQIWVSADPASAPDGALVAELFHAPGETSPLAVVILSFSELGSAPARLNFTPLPGPPEQSYYLTLKASRGEIRVQGRGEDAYPGGQAYINGIPAESDLAFRLSYDYGLAALAGDLLAVGRDLWLALPLACLLLLPGWLLLDLAGLGRRYDFGERTALALGLSMASVPLLMLWTTTAGVAWSRGAVLVVTGLLAAAALWRILKFRLSGSAHRSTGRSGLNLDLALAGVFLFSLAVRLIMARDLAGPAWVDSVHHALIARLTIDRGGFPTDYAPFLNLETAGYHPGFHSLVAAFHWLSGTELSSAMLLLGQVLNALSVFAVYLFTTTVLDSRRRTCPEPRRREVRLAGVVAALIAGVFTPMPAYYTSWGRYTQLAGLLILPAALALLARLGRIEASPFPVLRGRFRRADLARILLLSAVACGGLFLTHYRVTAFLALLLLALLANRMLAAALETIGRRGMDARWLERLTSRRQGAPSSRAAIEPGSWPIRREPWWLWNPGRVRGRKFTWNHALQQRPAVRSSAIEHTRSHNQDQPQRIWKTGSRQPWWLFNPRRIRTRKPRRREPWWLWNPGRPGLPDIEPDQEQKTFAPLSWQPASRIVRMDALLQGMGRLGLAAGLAFLLTLPWWPAALWEILPRSTAGAGGGNPQAFADFSWTYLTAALGKQTLVLAGLGLVWGIARRRWFALVLALWVALLFLAANLGALGLPGGSFINNTSVEIALFLPVSALGGYLVGQVDAFCRAVLPGRWRSLVTGLLAALGFGLALVGARQLIPILNPVTLLFREADRPAMSWIRENLPEDTTVLINPFAWGYGLYAGNDGGAWISPLTGRKTVPPPVLYGFGDPASIQQINAISQQAIEKSADPVGLHAALKGWGIPYLYVGRRGGVFSPRRLQESGLFETLYARDGVWIFRALDGG